jgi:hypothetical protein
MLISYMEVFIHTKQSFQPNPELSIQVQGLTKSYGRVRTLRDIRLNGEGSWRLPLLSRRRRTV